MRLPRVTVAAIGLALLAPSAPTARAQFDDPKPAADAGSSSSEIRDTAGIFSRDAVREALARLVNVERSYRVPTTIETVESLRGESIDDATVRLAKRLGPQAKGIFVLIAKNDRRIEVIASGEYPALKARGRRMAIRDAFLDDFKKGNFDEGLKDGVDMIEKTVPVALGEPSAVATPAPTRLAAPSHDADPSALLKRNQAKLTMAGAKRLIAAAEKKATEQNYKMNIAVVDDGGHLLAFSRMDDARPASVATAITKATSAATYRAETKPLPGSGVGAGPDVLLNLSLQNAAAASGGKISTLFGGIPIVVDGQVVGAVGCGGGSGEQDAEVARAAVAQFLADLGAPAGSNK